MGRCRSRRATGPVILADTSFLIRALVKGTAEDRALRRWLRQAESFSTSAIVWAEFLCGPLGQDELDLAALFVTERLEFAGEDAVVAARFFNEAGRRRGTLIDCMIAATAVRVGAALATANPTDFKRLQPLGLKVAAY